MDKIKKAVMELMNQGKDGNNNLYVYMLVKDKTNSFDLGLLINEEKVNKESFNKTVANLSRLIWEKLEYKKILKNEN